MSKASKTKPEGNKRHHIFLEPDVSRRAEKLAEKDRRSFSKLVAVLIDAEWNRQGLNKKAA